VELCEAKLPTYFINDEEKIISGTAIRHFNFHTKSEQVTENFLPQKDPLKILITSGASCPDALVEAVIEKIISFYPAARSLPGLLNRFTC
jgi:4-hydroxy-3-methylbut-2-enyl diphosphate reductase